MSTALAAVSLLNIMNKGLHAGVAKLVKNY